MRRFGSAFFWVAVAALLVASCSATDEQLIVFVPSSLTNAMEEAALEYEAETGVIVKLRVGGTGSLALELRQRAPADIFVSADIRWFDHLSEEGVLLTESRRILAWNKLVVVVPNSSLASIPRSIGALTILERIAIGDPQSVPAGQYAVEALQRLAAYEALESRLITTHDVRAALVLVERREADGGIVYASDALASDKVQIAFEIPEKTHEPIVYPAALVAYSERQADARRFLEFLWGPRGKSIFRKHGFGGA